VGFALFQGEEFGLVGSRRFAADVAAASSGSSSSSGSGNGEGSGEGSFACRNRVAAAANGGTDACLDPVYPSLAFEVAPSGSRA